MTIINKDLYNSLSALTKKTLEIIKDSQDVKLAVDEENTWVKRGGDLYQRCSIYKPSWGIFFIRIKDKILQTEEYKIFEDTAHNDKEIFGHVDKLVGTWKGRWQFKLDSIPYRLVSPFLPQLLEKDSYPTISDFHESIFLEHYLIMEQSFYTDKIVYERLTPISGFYSDEKEIVIDENISIIRLSDQEIEDFLNYGITMGHTFNNDVMSYMTQFAIKVTYALPKIYDSGDEEIEEMEEESEFYGPDEIEIAEKKEQDLIGWLRLFKKGEICPITTLTRGSKNIFSFGVSWNHEKKPRRFFRNNFTLVGEEVKMFVDFCSEFKNKSISDIQYMAIAIRRFGQASEREGVEDRIIDLCISAEALFLSSDLRVEGELVYRLSHRASMLIERDPQRQSEIFDFMKNTYNIRSGIVHGSNYKLPKREDGTDFTLMEICENLENRLRSCIKYLVTEKDTLFIMNKGRKLIIDWNLIVFRKKEDFLLIDNTNSENI